MKTSVLNISVVIPAYNAEKTIERAVLSVLKQPEVNEVIIVEDGCNDQTLTICKKLEAKYPIVKVLQHDQNQNLGPSATRNKGILAAQNQWIAFLDADDYYLDNRFAQTTKVISSVDLVDGVYEAIGMEEKEGAVKLTTLNKNTITGNELFYEITPIGNSGRFCADGFTVKKKVLQEAGLFEEDMRIGEDVLLWLKCAVIANLLPGNIENAVTMFSRENESVTSNVEVRYYLIVVYKKLLSWKHPLLLRSHKVKVVNKLLYIKLQQYSKKEAKVLGLAKYLVFLITTIVKYPYYICSKELIASLKDLKFFVKT